MKKYLFALGMIFVTAIAGKFLLAAPDWASLMFGWMIGTITYLHLRNSEMVHALGLLNLIDITKREMQDEELPHVKSESEARKDVFDRLKKL